ncbi:tail tubular protein B [Pseudomonas phage Njord]|uniref:Tail tubular protein B n=1 Tax=Pseudomonas phage Njord TaxID=2163985 RepID=A0A2S1GMM2_9CAUD|nr:tail tubular protein B [Pseudomonas phage Njord]AWD90619.1 tail tubular protein B [Pseudomonas phage Njord]
MIPSVLDGLYKRIGTKHIAQLPLTPDLIYDERTVIHFYDRGDEEKYFIFFEPNRATPHIFTTTGVKGVVSHGTDVLDYCTVENPLQDMSFSTIGDYTFIANGVIPVRARADVQPANPANMAIVYVQFSTYSRTYSIIINGVVAATHTTPGGTYTSPGDANNAEAQLDTTYVCGILAQKLRDLGTYNVSQVANCMFISKGDGPINTITTADGAGGSDLIAVQNRVKNTATLPPYAPNGWLLLIQANEGIKKNNWWLRAEGTDGSRVKWVESVEGGQRLGFNRYTMPHTLVRTSIVAGVPQFSLTQGAWEDRSVGNDTTNPFPSFLDGYVYSVGTFQNRLFFTSGEAAVFTRSNNFFDFWKESSQAELDSDPIDTFSDSEKVNRIKNSVTVDGDAIFFAESGQFMIDGSKPVTAANVVFKQVTSFPMNINAKPAITGESIMFSYNAGNYSGVREMFTDSDKDTKSARPITEHVEKYIEGQVRQLSSNPNTNVLLVRTEKDPHLAYVYDWMWQGADKVQAAWHKWTFDTASKLLHVQFVDDDVFLIFLHADGKVYLEHMPLTNDDDELGMTFPCRMDRKVVVDAVWDATAAVWRLTTPFDILNTDFTNWLAIQSVGCNAGDIGTETVLERGLGLNSFFTRDAIADPAVITTVKLVVGRKFRSRYIPTQPFIRDREGKVQAIDNITLGRANINYASTGQFTVFVTNSYGQQFKYPFYGRYMGSFNNKVGFAPLIDGTFPFPVRLYAHEATIEIQSDSHLPLRVRGLEWEGSYQQTGRRL